MSDDENNNNDSTTPNNNHKRKDPPPTTKNTAAAITKEWALQVLDNFQKACRTHESGKGCDYWWVFLMVKSSPYLQEHHTVVLRDVFHLNDEQQEQFIDALGGGGDFQSCLNEIETLLNETGGVVRGRFGDLAVFKLQRHYNDLQQRHNTVNNNNEVQGTISSSASFYIPCDLPRIPGMSEEEQPAAKKPRTTTPCAITAAPPPTQHTSTAAAAAPARKTGIAARLSLENFPTRTRHVEQYWNQHGKMPFDETTDTQKYAAGKTVGDKAQLMGLFLAIQSSRSPTKAAQVLHHLLNRQDMKAVKAEFYGDTPSRDESRIFEAVGRGVKAFLEPFQKQGAIPRVLKRAREAVMTAAVCHTMGFSLCAISNTLGFAKGGSTSRQMNVMLEKAKGHVSGTKLFEPAAIKVRCDKGVPKKKSANEGGDVGQPTNIATTQQPHNDATTQPPSPPLSPTLTSPQMHHRNWSPTDAAEQNHDGGDMHYDSSTYPAQDAASM